MTLLSKPFRRVTTDTLNGAFGADRGKRIVITLIPAHGASPAMIELRAERTRRPETITVPDLFRLAIWRRVNTAQLEKARKKKEEKAAKAKTRALEREVRRMAREEKTS